jgi:ribosomal protein L11 methyltransferase
MPTWPALVIEFPPSAPGGAAEPRRQDLVLADLDGSAIVAIVEESDNRWQVSFRDESHRAAAIDALHAARGPGALVLRAIEIEDGDWARRSQSTLRAIRVGRIVVAPPWDAAAAADLEDVMTVVVEPAMGFGSGHHATTRLCLHALQRVEVRGRRVLDVGTGSGVLALAAVRLGAASVLAIDIDPDALENARGNAELNGAPRNAEFRQADFRQDTRLEADVAVANLTGGMLMSGAVEIARTVVPGGALILSGITLEERDAVYRVFERGFRLDWATEEDGWCCALLRAAR